MNTDVLDRPKVDVTGTGDHDRFAHYFRKSDIEAAYIEGAEITALCGKKDVPTRDFTQFPVCKTCEEIVNGFPE